MFQLSNGLESFIPQLFCHSSITPVAKGTPTPHMSVTEEECISSVVFDEG